MTTLIKIIVATVLSLTLFSCNFDIRYASGVRGNGNVQIEERPINESFNTIKATEGLHVYVTQGNRESIIVEADENLQELIVTEVIDHVLKIHTTENIGHSTTKKVTVTFKDVSEIISTSGSNLHSTNTITTDQLTLKSTSGSKMTLDVKTTLLECKTTSGSNLRLSGNTKSLIAEATSGSNFKAGDLFSESSDVKATSGSNITVYTSKALTAKATSGANIKYYGNPDKVEKNKDVSGNIRKQ
jgi:hypothetical protein